MLQAVGAADSGKGDATMKSMFLLLLFLVSLPANALRLQTIDLNDWNVAYSKVTPKIIIDCDCIVTIDAEGNENVSFKTLRSLRKVGNEISCVVANPSDFLKIIANNKTTLLAALLLGGGASWTSYDNGVTWWRMLPGSKVPETPDSWCLQ